MAGRSVLRRIETINATSRSIMGGDLSRRVPVRGSNDELDDLAVSLNAMLDRIEQLMNGLREVSDNIAHDLKTPLNRLRNRAEAALRDPRGSEAYREGLEGTIEKADDLIKTFNALLLIARLEAGVVDDSAERFDLGKLVGDVAELYEPVAEEAGLGLTIEVSKRDLRRCQPAPRRPGGGQPGRQRHQIRQPRRGETELEVHRRQGAGERNERRDQRRGSWARHRRKGPGAGVAPLRPPRGEPQPSPARRLGLSLVAAVARLHWRFDPARGQRARPAAR